MLTVDLSGRRGLIVGVANSSSIGWGCAKAARAAGARIAMTYHTEKARPHVSPLALKCGAEMLMHLDVLQEGGARSAVEMVKEQWGGVDFVLHSIAFAPRSVLHGGLTGCDAADFATMMRVSCHSFAELAGLCAPLMPAGGSFLTVSYLGAVRALRGYEAMGAAKAALEAAVRGMALELGGAGIRVNAISPGPIPTRAAGGLPRYAELENRARENAFIKRPTTIEDAGALAAFLFSPLAGGITGQVIRVDGGESAAG